MNSIEERQNRIKCIEKIIQIKPIPYENVIATICYNLGISDRKAKEYLKLLHQIKKISIENGVVKWKK